MSKIIKRESVEHFPLTPSQLDIYLDQARYPSSNHYTIGGVVDIQQAIDPSLFIEAEKRLLDHDPIFRIAFSTDEEGVFQWLGETNKSLIFQDLSNFADPESKANELIRDNLVQPIDIREPGLFKTYLFKLEPQRYWFGIYGHHLITDGYGYSNWINQIFENYLALAGDSRFSLNQSGLTFIDVIDKEASYLSGARFEKDKRFWQEIVKRPFTAMLKGSEEKESGEKSSVQKYPISQTKYQQYKSCAEELTIGIHQLFLLSTAIAFNKRGGSEQFFVGMPSYNRSGSKQKQIIGSFTSVSPLYIDLSNTGSIAEVALRIQQEAKSSIRHQKFPLTDLFQLARNENATIDRLFDLQFNYQKLDYKYVDNIVKTESFYVTPESEKIPFAITLCEYGDHQPVELQFEANESFFSKDEIEGIAESVFYTLNSITENPQIRLADLSSIGPKDLEAYSLLNETVNRPIEESSLIQSIKNIAVKNPERNALEFDGNNYSYQELSQSIASAAVRLKENGICPGDYVGLCFSRSPDTIFYALATMSLGAHFVPMDPSYPEDRLNYFVEDSDAKVVVIDHNGSKKLNKGLDTTFLSLDKAEPIDSDKIERISTTLQNFSEPVGGYVIYTSGSTGKPKGVEVAAKSLSIFIDGMNERVNLDSDSSVIATTTFGFDISLYELFGALAIGGQVVLANEAESKSPDEIAKLVNNAQNPVLQGTPSFWQMVLDGEDSLTPELTALTGGEALSYSLAKTLTESFKNVYNCYGPTEATIWSLVNRVELTEGETIYLNQSLPSYSHYILSGDEIAPVGVAGELAIAGPCLATKYKNRISLTEERFVNKRLPVSLNASDDAETRLYKTGDLAKLNSDGSLTYLGREDHQVKLRGFRVELTEIESVLLETGLFSEVAVGVQTRAGSPYLVGYLVAKPEFQSQTDRSLLEQGLEQKLPNYMVPKVWVELEELPKTANQKVDRNKLPKPQDLATGQNTKQRKDNSDTPISELERTLLDMWCNLFGTSDIDLEDNFFSLGGHSLLAMKLFGRIKQAFGVTFQLSTIFEYPSISELAEKIRSESVIKNQSLINSPVNDRSNIEPLLKRNTKGPVPANQSQRSIWLVSTLTGNGAQFNMPGTFKLAKKPNLDALEAALKGLIKSHPILDSGFELRDEVLWVSPLENFDTFDLKLKQVESSNEFEQFRLEDSLQEFNLEQDVKVRATVLELHEEYYLTICFHHIAVDGWSLSILVNDLNDLYQSYAAGTGNSLLDALVAKPDFFTYINNNTETTPNQLEEFWLDYLDEAPLVHELPYENIEKNESIKVAQVIEKSIVNLRDLKLLAKRNNLTLFNILQGIYALSIGIYSGQKDIVTGTPVAGRANNLTSGLSDKETGTLDYQESIVGCFTNSLPLRAKLDFNLAFVDWIIENTQSNNQVLDRQSDSFSSIVEVINPDRSKDQHPIFQLWFVLQNQPGYELYLDNGVATQLPVPAMAQKFDLSLSITELEDYLNCEWQYGEDIGIETAEEISNLFAQLVNQLVSHPTTKIAELDYCNNLESIPSMKSSRDWDLTKTIITQFEQTATAIPSAPAVVFADQSLTFQQLNSKSNQLANHLSDLGVKQGECVGICLNRSVELLLAQLAIMKLGAAYVPLDPQAPSQRIQFITRETNLQLVVSDLSTQGKIEALNLPTFKLGHCGSDSWLSHCSNEFTSSATHQDLAYVLFTSGSTGKPKGVAVNHRSLSNLAVNMKDILSERGLKHNYRWAWSAPMMFDASVQAITQLAFGAALHLISEEDRKDPKSLVNFLVEQKIDLMDSTPSLVELVLQEADRNQFTLPSLLIGGEAISHLLWKSLANHHKDSSNFALNVYGPTECTVNTTFADITSESRPHLGLGLGNISLHVMNDQLQELPIGAKGELFIGGECLAVGYHNNDELTDERFIHHPEFGRLYKTGDQVRRNHLGQLEFIGRLDFQVKVRGYRIELGEIEKILKQEASVQEAVVLVKDDQLNAFIVGTNPKESELIARMESMLPPYMVARQIQILDAMPLTRNGKQDRKALLALTEESEQQLFVPPSNETEKVLQEIWEELLGQSPISVEANFFEIGGHSLLAIRLASACRERFEVELPITQIMSSPTIFQLALLVEQVRNCQQVVQTTHPKTTIKNTENKRIVI